MKQTVTSYRAPRHGDRWGVLRLIKCRLGFHGPVRLVQFTMGWEIATYRCYGCERLVTVKKKVKHEYR